MQAVRFVGVGRPAQIEDVPKPVAGPGQVLVRTGGAGVCHLGLHVMNRTSASRRPSHSVKKTPECVVALRGGVAGSIENARRRRHRVL